MQQVTMDDAPVRLPVVLLDRHRGHFYHPHHHYHLPHKQPGCHHHFHRQCKQQHLSLASIRSILIYIYRNGRPTLVRLCLFLFLLSFAVLITIVDALVEIMHVRFDQQKDDNELFISSIFHECACDGVSPLLNLLLCLPACLSSVSVFVCLCVCDGVSPLLNLLLCLPACLSSVSVFVCLCVCLPASLSVCFCVCLSVSICGQRGREHASIRLSVSVSLSLSVFLAVSVCLSAPPPPHPSHWLT